MISNGLHKNHVELMWIYMKKFHNQLKKFLGNTKVRDSWINQALNSLQAGAIKRLIPLLDRILVQKAEAVTKTAGGIVIPEKAQSKVLRATVIAVGPGARNKVSCTHTHTTFYMK